MKTGKRRDDIKDELITEIFTHGVYLPPAREDQHRLVKYMDIIINKTEVVIRRLVDPENFHQEFPLLAPVTTALGTIIWFAVNWILLSLSLGV